MCILYYMGAFQSEVSVQPLDDFRNRHACGQQAQRYRGSNKGLTKDPDAVGKKVCLPKTANSVFCCLFAFRQGTSHCS